MSRRTVSATGTDRNFARQSSSQSEPARTHAPNVMASATFKPPPAITVAVPATKATTATGQSRAARFLEVAPLPGEEYAERHGQEKRHEDRDHGGIEERCANGDFRPGQRLQGERIERAEQHDAEEAESSTLLSTSAPSRVTARSAARGRTVRASVKREARRR